MRNKKAKVRFADQELLDEEVELMDRNDLPLKLVLLSYSVAFIGSAVHWTTVLSLAKQYNLSDLLYVSLYSFVSTLGSAIIPESLLHIIGLRGSIITYKVTYSLSNVHTI
ncbi:UNVERIFIED_CONTAM: hypothetical protein HDU68_008911 [Siphonaria sp. JEL0065]|nr:hypothetical protein HDU68_008911 [Siphonaria sp. JEL0065]